MYIVFLYPSKICLNFKVNTFLQLYFRPMSPKAPPLPPGLGLSRELPMAQEGGGSAKAKGKTSPTDRKTPTRKTPTRTPTKTTPTKTSPRKSPTGSKGQRTPTIPAFSGDANKPGASEPPKKTPSPVDRQGSGRVSRGSRQLSKGRNSRASRKEVDIDGEDETRPFSQALEEPLTQVEIESGGDTDRGAEGGNTDRDDQPNESYV